MCKIAGENLLFNTGSPAMHSVVISWGGMRERMEAEEEGDVNIIWLICVVVQQKPLQYCKAFFLQLEINLKNKIPLKHNK